MLWVTGTRALKVAIVAACFACAALIATAGASADTACKVNEAPCSKANAWEQETVFEWEIRPETEFEFTGLRTWKCSESTRADRLFYNPVGGGPGQGDGVTPLSETFAGCISPSFGSCTASAGGFPSNFKWFANAGSPGDGQGSKTLETAGLVTFTCSFGQMQI